MKKILNAILITVITLTTMITFAGCKTDNLSTISENLTNYTIDFDIDVANKTVSASQTVDYVNDSQEELDDVRFHLYPRAFCEGVVNMTVSKTQSAKAYPNGVSYASIEISKLSVAGKEIEANYSGEDKDILVAKLDERLVPSARVKIEINYSIIIPNILHRFGYGENTINLGNIYPVACVREESGWSECPYHPNGDPFYSNIANYNVTASYDSSYTMAVTGESTTIKQSNKNKTTATARAVRDFAMVLSNKFSVLTADVNGVKVNYYYFDDENAGENLQISKDALSCFSKKFYKYPYSTLSVVKADFVHGGMEYPNLVYISADIDDKLQYQNCIVHEIAHQWWYGLVGNNEYTEAWLDEPLAEFSTALFYKWHSNYNVRYRDVISSAQDNISLFLSVYREVLGTVDTSMNRPVNKYPTDAEYVYNIYVKGVLMYDCLMSSIGERKLVGALSDYAHQYAFKNATGNDLIKCFEKSTKIKLNEFFNSWVNGSIILN